MVLLLGMEVYILLLFTYIWVV